MKNFLLSERFKNLKDFSLEKNDLEKIFLIFKFLIFSKEEFFLKQNQFFYKIHLIIKNINCQIFKKKIYIFFRDIKKYSNSKSIGNLYDKIFLFLIEILSKKNKIIFFKTAKKFDFENTRILKNILNENKKENLLMIHKIDPEIYSGFQIYTEKERYDFSWRKVFNKLFKKIEKNYFEEELDG